MKTAKSRTKIVRRNTILLLLVLALLAGFTPNALALPESDLPSEAIGTKAWGDNNELNKEGVNSLEGDPTTIYTTVVRSATEITYPVTGGNLYFDTATGKITDCDTTVTEAVIPSEINGIQVTRIKWSAFSNCTALTRVTIPDSVTYIEDGAFSGCSSLDSIILPDSVTFLESSVFSDCTNLTSITIPDGITMIGAKLFNNCSSLISVTLPDSVIKIGENAFSGCSSLTNVTIPDNVVEIEWGAFSGCNSLTEITLPNSVTSIESKTFSRCSSLTSVTIPDSVIEIGWEAFYGCSSLTSVKIPDSVIEIGSRAFSDCSSLTDVTLPDGITVIEAFDGCSSLVSIILPDSVTEIGNSAFYGCNSLTNITIPNSVTKIGDSAFYGCCSLTNITIPAGVTTIGRSAFQRCSSLTSIKILDGVTMIGDYAFAQCNGLTNVSIPGSVTSIGIYAFIACQNMTSVTINGGAPYVIGDFAFHNCDSLANVALGNGLTSIGEDAFSACPSLTNVIIPDSVISIGAYAFSFTTNVYTVIFLGDAPDIVAASEIDGSFPYNAVFYYIAGKSGWTSPTWNGYKTEPIFNAENEESHVEEYYNALRSRSFSFVDISGKSVTDVTVTVSGQTFQSGSSSSLAFSYDGKEPIVISKKNYYDVSLPGYVQGGFNQVVLHAASENLPFVQAAYGSQNGGKSYSDLIKGRMSFYAGSLTEKTAFYFDVNWAGHREGNLYLSQTTDPEDGFAVQEGLNDPFALSLHLKSGGGLYLLMVTDENVVFAQKLAANILSESIDLDLDFGQTPEIPAPNDNFLSNFEFGLSLPKDAKVKMSIEPDGTVLASLGVKISEGKDVKTTVETIKDALYYADNYPKDWDSFVNALNGSIIPRSSSFVVAASCDLVGYAEGKLVEKADGSLDILFTEGKMAVKIKGSVKHTWQIYAWGVPFYVGGSVDPSVEVGVTLWSNDRETPLLIEPLNVKGKVPIKVRGGLGWDTIASAGIYGKGSITAELTIPVSTEDLKIYVNASFGAEATFFCFDADLEIYKTDNFYLYGKSEKKAALMHAVVPDTENIDWKPQSRNYLSAPSLFAVGEDDVQTGVQTVVPAVYPYANVQLAVLSDGTQLMVWTADPGISARPQANNRTVLYYSWNSGSGWSTPAPVEASDDGTGDFNPTLQVLDGIAYLLWQDASRALTAADDVSTTAKTMDISVAAFHPTDGTFTTLGSVGTEFYDGAVSIGLADGKPAVVWASNSGDSPLSANGRVGSLHQAVWDGAQFSVRTLAENLGAIDQTATNGSSVWFSADTDYQAGTVADREIFRYDGSLTQLTQNEVADTKPSYQGGTLLWYSDGSLVTETGASIPMAEGTDRYAYIQSESGMQAVVYTITDEVRNSSFYASFNDGTGWGQPILLNSASGNIGSFSAQFLPDGTLSIAASERTVGSVTGEYDVPELSESACLRIYSASPLCDLAVDTVTYLPHSMVPNGTLDMQLELKNQGMTSVRMAEVTVTNGTTTVSQQTYLVDLLSGGTKPLSISVPLPETVPEQLQVNVQPVGYTDSNEENNRVALSLRLRDISLEGGTCYSDGEEATASVLVANRGQTSLFGATLNLYNREGELLSTAPAPALNPGDSAFVTFDLDMPLERNSILTVEASESGEENLMSNNSCLILVSAPVEQKFSMTATYTITDDEIAVVVNIQNTTSVAREYQLYCSSYDANGKLLQTSVSGSLSTRSNEETNSQLTLPAVSSASIIKVFMLSQSNAPLLDSIEIKIS